MSKCAVIEPMVKRVLEENPATREDDFTLVYEVFKKFVPNIDELSFKEVMMNHKHYKLPYFETVRRTRPKLQNMYPELQPSSNVLKGRQLEEVDCRNYALSK